MNEFDSAIFRILEQKKLDKRMRSKDAPDVMKDIYKEMDNHNETCLTALRIANKLIKEQKEK